MKMIKQTMKFVTDRLKL